MEENDLEQLDIAAAEFDIDLGEAMKRLQTNEDFITIFQERFIDAWAITNTMNMASYDKETQIRVHHKMIARGEFSKFCQDIIETADAAQEALNMVKAEP